ncbi:type II toxin-antitoxin system RelE/ParE family toxin [Tropicibacter sp. Alg240-R139]|uniref:type II toxin-antitoxin system RelE/ParE family toxin n=1 Tax=Tropicibacter sp. Alg240-R139 TaxID=2305991 RepID=UPI001F079E59|nr:type II toxin-antitoxin system RelE/ParE family toxin [Tropicibacter sp. Alg240-R139]
MAQEIRFRPRVVSDLDDIWAYSVERWGEAQAADYLNGLDAAFGLLTEFPDMARLRLEFTPPVRIHPFREHVIIYMSDDSAIDVVRVVHGRANWMELLAD